MAETIEDSDYTSAQKRAGDLRSRDSGDGVQVSGKTAPQSKRGARHLSPVDLKERSAKPGPDVHMGGSRCSNKGFLSMTTVQYLELLDWTARQVVEGKAGATPKHVEPLMQRLGLTEETWCSLVKDFCRLFSVVAGQPHRIDEHRSARTSDDGSPAHRYRARREARDLFSTAK